MRFNEKSTYFRVNYIDQATGTVKTFDSKSVVEVKKTLKALIQSDQTSLSSVRAFHGREDLGFDAVHAWIIQDTNALLTQKYKLGLEAVTNVIQQIETD